MPSTNPAISLDVARRLQLRGDWDLALTVLDGQTSSQAVELRAEILFDTLFWRLDGLDAAADAIAAVDPTSVWVPYLTARLAYTRLSFFEPLADDYDTAEAGYRVVAADPTLQGWGEFHWGVLEDNIGEDPARAMRRYLRALEFSRTEGDLVLESYVIRHMAGHAFDRGERTEALQMLRRSLHLRAASGMRPQIAAAQLALARELPADDPERTALIQTSRAVANELKLAWVQQGLAEL